MLFAAFIPLLGKQNPTSVSICCSSHCLKTPYIKTLFSAHWTHRTARCASTFIYRGVVVRERGGTPLRQIFWSRNGAPANIVCHRWNANTEAFEQITSYSLSWPSISLFSGPNCPQRGIWHQKSQLKFSGGNTPGPPQRKGATPSRTHPSTAAPMRGAQAPPLLGPRSRKPFPQIKIYHYTPVYIAL